MNTFWRWIIGKEDYEKLSERDKKLLNLLFLGIFLWVVYIGYTLAFKEYVRNHGWNFIPDSLFFFFLVNIVLFFDKKAKVKKIHNFINLLGIYASVQVVSSNIRSGYILSLFNEEYVVILFFLVISYASIVFYIINSLFEMSEYFSRIVLVFLCSLLLITIVFYYVFNSFSYSIFLSIFVTGVVSLLLIGLMIYTYVEFAGKKEINPQSQTTPKANETTDLAPLVQLIQAQNVQIKQLQEQQAQSNKQLQDINEKVDLGGVTEQRQQALFEGLQNALATHINQDFFAELNSKVANAVDADEKQRFEKLWDKLQKEKDRLQEEIRRLNNQSNINLIIGILTTFGAFGILAYTILEYKGIKLKIEDMYPFIPRVALSVFVEIFAYFFLRLYKQGLAEIKYYQNEITTIEMKISALYTAIHFGQSKDVSSVIGELLRVERNFILKKGETTAEIEKARIEQGNQQSLLKLVSDITGAIKNGGANEAKKEK